MKIINWKNISQTILAILLSILSNTAIAECVSDSFEEWKECFIQEKLSDPDLQVNIDTFRQAQFLERVVELDKKQPEKKLTYSEYRRLIKIDNKIERAKIFYRDNKTLIDEIGEKYGVEPEIIVALIALESDLGEVQGNFNIVDALASLSFEGRRKSFFEKELINILKISYSENVPYENLKGSWAGAMGQCQFMPSNYVAYAVDHAADGFKDIWNDKADVFASAANYLKQNGWKYGNSSVSSISSKNLQKKEYSICKNTKNCQLDKNNLLITVNESDNIDAIYKVGSNYNVLMKWNRSSYFVISALKIAAGINIG